MLSGMGLLEWEDDDLPLRQGVPVEGEREADGDDGEGVERSNTTTPLPFEHRYLQHRLPKRQREHPNRSDCDPEGSIRRC